MNVGEFKCGLYCQVISPTTVQIVGRWFVSLCDSGETQVRHWYHYMMEFRKTDWGIIVCEWLIVQSLLFCTGLASPKSQLKLVNLQEEVSKWLVNNPLNHFCKAVRHTLDAESGQTKISRNQMKDNHRPCQGYHGNDTQGREEKPTED